MANTIAGESVLEERLSPSIQKLWTRFYPGHYPTRFRDLLIQNIHASNHVLEIGAGSGRGKQNRFELRNRVARYAGVDPVASVLTNPYLEEAHHCKADSLPFADASFDLVFHCFVAEHFELPLTCNQEIRRVLKPGGLLLFQTPSRHYYPMLAARITPHWFHEFYIRHLGSGRTEEEVFPTFYRLNDDKRIANELHSCGFSFQIEHHSIPPGYLRFSVPTFLAGVLFERTIEKWFPALRGWIIVLARKTT